MIIKRIAKVTTPLCFLNDRRLLCYSQGKLVVMVDGIIQKTIPLPIGFKERLLGRSKLITRLLRFGVRVATAVDDNNVILCIGNTLYEVNLETNSISKGWSCGHGVRPLIFTDVIGIDGIPNGIYFGGYLSNGEKNPVNIYHRLGVDIWEVVYTFPQGSINHVHNIVVDSYRNCLWVFTGDFDEASAIWKVSDHFRKFERIAGNNQKYRGCVVFALAEGLLYATDAPFADDYIYLMNPDTSETKALFPIDGSCIYGCKWKDNYVFSSTVEGDGRNTPKLEFLFGRKRGAGIKDDYVHMYMGNLKEGFKEIYKEKKDNMPYYTFQFGVFKFPVGKNNSDTLFFQPVATTKNDSCLIGCSF
ncbi:MAG: hypothetical protein KBF13_00025 [Prevotella sp.]|nr:hypothetical protein [Prevotella sp.]